MTTKKLAISFLRNIRDLSKTDIIEFFRKRVNSKLQCVEDLGTGTDFCLGMNLLFPNSCDANKIKKGHNLSECSRRANFNLLKKAFKTFGVDKNFPLESMIKQNFQSIFFFAQWFVRFFEANRKAIDMEEKVKNKKTMKFKKGGARSIPAEGGTTTTNDERSLGILSPDDSFSRIVAKRQIPSQILIYDKFGNVSAVKIFRKDQMSQTKESTPDNDKERIKSLVEVQEHLQRINVERKECIANLQKEHDDLLEALENSTRKKSYFHKKLNLVEKLCDECHSDTLRASLRRVLYREGLPM